ncbi:stabilin-2-like [Littorina saxatilis]|uniref:stabilin-2-like n=1 Tax=Littorina saxatilis TaxID=31220 RepID=UPI0038B61322
MIAFKSAQMTSVAMLLIMTLTQSLRAHGQLSESNSKHYSDDDDDDDDNDYYAYDYLAVDDSPRFCNVTASRLLPGDCTWPCTNSSTCPEGSVLDSFEDCELEPWQKALQARSFNVSDSDEGNSSASTEDDSVFDPASLQACRAVCAEDFVEPQCCSGFFGASCLWCPRNEGQVCSGHGQCNDGLEGDGACQCFKNFTGILCEVCTNKEMYGQNCTEECRCVNGYCDNGPTGSGNCTFCFPGFQGSVCDQDIITCHNLTCANNSQCEEVNGQSKCVCDPGFKGGDPSNGIACTPINHCEEEGHGSKVCGHGMQCVFTGPGTYECQCQEGYEQYGVRCHAINPCLKDNGGCDLETTTCFHTGPNTSQCDCLAFYESYVPGEGCTLVDVCPIANCHANANCTTIGPNEHRCSCLPGYVGDGEKNCFGNIVQRLSELNRQHPTLRGQLSMSLGLIDRLYRTAMEQHGPFTIFIPNNRAYRRARKDFKYADMLKQPRRTRQLLRQHILLGKLTLEDLQGYDNYYTLQGTIADLQVRVAKNVFKYKIRGFSNKVKVISRDFPASNGMIHIVNELLMNEPIIVGDKTKTAMQLIQQEGRFNRLQTLINSLGVDHVFDRDNITVFAPENGGLDNLPEGTLEYLTTDEEGKEKLRTLLENHIFAGRISVTDLVSMKRIHSVANYAFDVSITDVGRIQLMGKVNISQTDIPCRNAVYYHIDGPLIPDELADILPSRCDIVRNTTIKGRCTLCDGDLHCPLKSDKFDGEVAEACYFWGTMSGVVAEVPGCQPICVRTYTIPKCCPGFHGKDCRSCPGGHKNPCNGHGECMDERFGTGFCLCDRNFRGEKCELCMDRKNFGPNCTDRKFFFHIYIFSVYLKAHFSLCKHNSSTEPLRSGHDFTWDNVIPPFGQIAKMISLYAGSLCKYVTLHHEMSRMSPRAVLPKA